MNRLHLITLIAGCTIVYEQHVRAAQIEPQPQAAGVRTLAGARGAFERINEAGGRGRSVPARDRIASAAAGGRPSGGPDTPRVAV